MAAALKAERDTLGLAQTEVANKLGTKQQTYGRWEKGSRPDEGSWPAIAGFLNVETSLFEEWCASWWPGGVAPRSALQGSNSRSSTDLIGDDRSRFVQIFLERWRNESMPSAVVEAVARELGLGE